VGSERVGGRTSYRNVVWVVVGAVVVVVVIIGNSGEGVRDAFIAQGENGGGEK